MTSAPAKFKIIKLKEDEVLYREGDVSQSMFLVKTGVISVYSQKRGKSFELVRIQAGQLIGELAFFNPSPRTSHAKALVETELIEIAFSEVQKDFEKFPAWVKILLNTMSSQVLKFSRELKQFRVADENEPEALNALVLRYLSGFLHAADLFGTHKGDLVELDRTALKQVTTYLSQLSPHKSLNIAKALGGLSGYRFEEKGEDFSFVIESLSEFRKLIKSMLYYVATHPQLLFPSAEDLDFVIAVRNASKEFSTDPRGLVTVPSAPIAAELKAMNSKANMTMVDSLIQLGLPIQKKSGSEGLELYFSKEDVLGISYVWEILNGVLKANPFKTSEG